MTKQQGWIKLHRSLQECWIWFDDEKFSKGQAWVDLLLMANHRDKKISVDGKPTVIVKGQLLTSIVKLSKRWNWDRKTVTRFLDILEKDGMLVQNKTHRWTTLTIVNYSLFQETTDKSMDNYMDNYTDNSMDTNKNIKNVKNEKNILRSVFYPDDEELNNAFAEYVLMRKKLKKPFVTDHAIELAMNKLERLSDGNRQTAILILNQSVRESWQGLFELKPERTKQRLSNRYESNSELEESLLSN